MVGQGHIDAVRKLLAERDLRVVYNALAHHKMRQRDIGNELLEFIGELLVVQGKPLFYARLFQRIAHLARKAKAAPHQHGLHALIIQRDHHIVV